MAEDPNEIAALKARLAMLERGKPGKQRGIGCVGMTLIGLGLLIVAGVIGQTVSGGARGPSSAEPIAASAGCDKTYSTLLYERARKAGLIRGVDMSREDGVVVLVRRRLWEGLEFSQQQRLAAALDCGIASPGYLRSLRFRTERSGADLYGLQATDLLRLREQGLAKAPG